MLMYEKLLETKRKTQSSSITKMGKDNGQTVQETIYTNSQQTLKCLASVVKSKLN